MSEKVINFPANGNKLPLHLEPADDLISLLQTTEFTHHTEIFEYEDDSYVMLVQPKDNSFSLERAVFMAERLKLDLFNALPGPDEDDTSLPDGSA